MNKNKKFLFISLSGLALLSVLRYSGNVDYWIIDFFSQFPFQYAILAFTLLLICLWRKIISLAVIAGLLVSVNISVLVDSGGGVQASRQATPVFKIYSANINIDNTELSKLNQEVQELNPEIVLLLEVTPEHVEQIRSMMQTYPYRIEKTSIGTRGNGFIFLSKFPLLTRHVTQLSERGNSILEVVLDINQKPVVFYGIHAQRPDRGNLNERKSQLLVPARQIREELLPAIVAGDFNTTPFSPVFKEFMRIAELKDSREGFGWLPSWPAYFPPLWIPIDHILVSPDITVHKRETGSYIGSDHYPVFAELSIADSKNTEARIHKPE